MKMRFLIIAASGLLFITGCANTTSAERTARTMDIEVVDDEDKVTHVCRTERAVGTNIGRRTCRSREQITAEQEEAQREIGHLIRGNAKAPVGN